MSRARGKRKSRTLADLSPRQRPQDFSDQYFSIPAQYVLPPQLPVADSSVIPERQGPHSTIMLQDGKPTGSSIVEPDSVLYKDGRTYHGYDEGKYFLPNDGEEQDRLDLQHAMSHLLLHEQFGWAPFKEPPKKVLDIATGTGIWALEFARQNPESHVIGTDLSLIQPPPDVPNCDFVRENSETSEWIFPHFFDYIHVRWTIVCFDDTQTVLEKAFDRLEPGGWLELLDPICAIGFGDGPVLSFEKDTHERAEQASDKERERSPEEDTAVYRYMRAMEVAYRNLKRDPYKATKYKKWLEELGFLDIEQKELHCPMSPWPKDPEMRQVGSFCRADMKRILQSTGKFWEAAGISKDDQVELTRQIIKELDEVKVEGYMPFYLTYGRKPLESEMTDAQKAKWAKVKGKAVADKPSYPTPPQASDEGTVPERTK